MTVLFSNRQKFGIKVMFCQILQFVSVLKTQQIKILIVQVFTFRIARVFLPSWKVMGITGLCQAFWARWDPKLVPEFVKEKEKR